MKYSLPELKEIILPMIESLATYRSEQLADAIIELIKQDREANAETS